MKKKLLLFIFIFFLAAWLIPTSQASASGDNGFFIQEAKVKLKVSCTVNYSEYDSLDVTDEKMPDHRSATIIDGLTAVVEGETKLKAFQYPQYPGDIDIPGGISIPDLPELPDPDSFTEWPFLYEEENYTIKVNGSGSHAGSGTSTGVTNGPPNDPDLFYFPITRTTVGSWTYRTANPQYDEVPIIGNVIIHRPSSEGEKPRYEFEFNNILDNQEQYVDISGEITDTISDSVSGTSSYTYEPDGQASGYINEAIMAWADEQGGKLEGELSFNGIEYQDAGQTSYNYSYNLDSPVSIDNSSTEHTINAQAFLEISWEVISEPGIKAIQPIQVLGRYDYRSDDDFDPVTDFVAGKDTAIQVFFEEEVPVDKLTNVTVEVIRDGGSVVTLSDFTKNSENNALVFMPKSRSQCDNWKAGNYTFKAKLKDSEKTSESVLFKERRKLNILAVPVRANYAGIIVEAGNQWKTGGAYMRRVYPVAYNDFTYTEGNVFNASDISFDITTIAGRRKLWEGLNTLKVGNDYNLIIGFIEDGITLPNGSRLQGYTWGAPSNIVVNTDEDMPATIAHEVAHVFGVGDEYNGGSYALGVNSPPPGYTGKVMGTRNPIVASDPKVKPYPGAQGSLISKNLHPFDTGGRGLLKDSISFMGSGAAQSKNWISVSVWKHLFRTLTPVPAAAKLLNQKSFNATEGTRVIEASGWVSNAGQVEFSLPWTSYTTTEPVVANTGTYTIQALDEGGQVLASQGFTPLFHVNTNPPEEIDPAPFVKVIVPFPIGTIKFRVVNENNSVLKEIIVSAGIPTIRVTAPTGELEVAGAATITWTAEDPDADSLQYKVEYSPDGSNWSMLAFRLTDTQWVQDFSELPGGDRAQIRITASDGINSATATSDSFRVPMKRPEVYIEQPTSDFRTFTPDGVILSGSSYDPQEGQIYDDDRLIWTSDRGGELGRGPTVFATNLAEGKHVITLTATSSAGLSNSQSIDVNINSHISLKPSTTLTVGETEQLIATVLPSDATNMNVTWEIMSEGNVVSVSSTGLITALSPGVAVIRATSTLDNEKYAECTVTVIDEVEFRATPHVQIGINPLDGDSAGIFVGLKDIADEQGNPVPDAMLASYQIEIDYNHNLAKILKVVDESQLGEFVCDTDTNTDKISVAGGFILGSSNFEQLFFVPLALTGTSTSSTDVVVKFASISDLNSNLISIPDVTLTLQRGKIVNEASQQPLSIADAVAGLQYLANLVDAGMDEGNVNVINMASILLPEVGATNIKPNVKDIIALMQHLVGLRDDSFQLLSVSEPTLKIGSCQIEPGETAVVAITGQNIPSPGLAGYQISIEYDPLKLEVIGLVRSASDSFSMQLPNFDLPGTVKLAAIQTTGVKGEITLAQLRFKAKDSAAVGRTELKLSIGELVLADLRALQAQGIYGQVNISAGSNNILSL